MRKLLIALITLLIFLPNITALEIKSDNAVLYNLNDSKIVFEKNKDEITSIASLTKIMTTLVAIENISNLDAKVTVKRNMLEGLVEANAAVIGLKIGQSVTYNDLLYGTFLASGADATKALTISISGSEEAFVELMNKKAKKLGLDNTFFSNTTGLDYKKQSSTVNEVAKLLMKALENTKFNEIFYSKSYTFSDKSKTVYSTLYKTASAYKVELDYVLGGKTGYTKNAGRCLASIAEDLENQIKYLLITTNAPTDNGDHVKDAKIIYDYYFENYKYYDLVNKQTILTSLSTKYSKIEKVDFYSDRIIKIYHDKTFDINKLKIEYKGLNILKAGLMKNAKIGNVKIFYDDIEEGSIDIILKEDIKFSLLEFIKTNIIIISISTFIVILIIIKIKK